MSKKSLLFWDGTAQHGTNRFMVLKSKVAMVQLPAEKDLFLDSYGNDLGVFAWDHYLYVTNKLQMDGTEI